MINTAGFPLKIRQMNAHLSENFRAKLCTRSDLRTKLVQS